MAFQSEKFKNLSCEFLIKICHSLCRLHFSWLNSNLLEDYLKFLLDIFLFFLSREHRLQKLWSQENTWTSVSSASFHSFFILNNLVATLAELSFHHSRALLLLWHRERLILIDKLSKVLLLFLFFLDLLIKFLQLVNQKLLFLMLLFGSH